MIQKVVELVGVLFSIMMCCDVGEGADRRIANVLWNRPRDGSNANAAYDDALDFAKEYPYETLSFLSSGT